MLRNQAIIVGILAGRHQSKSETPGLRKPLRMNARTELGVRA